MNKLARQKDTIYIVISYIIHADKAGLLHNLFLCTCNVGLFRVVSQVNEAINASCACMTVVPEGILKWLLFCSCQVYV